MAILTLLILVLGTVNLIRMTVFIIGSDIYAYRARKAGPARAKPLPPFSVIIPAHNEERTVRRAIQSVLRSDYPRDLIEIVVVDDGSRDRTWRLAESYRLSYGVKRLTVVTQPQSGKARALNHALRHHVSGKLVMCLDADSYLAPNALREMAHYFEDPRVAATSANVKIVKSGGLLNLIQQVEYIICYQMKRAQTVFNIEYIIGGIGSVFRRSVIRKIGYYDADTVTEDIDLTMKILQLGNKKHRVIYGARAIAYTEAVLDLGGLIRQRFRWKWGRCQTFLKNWNLFFNRGSQYTRGLTYFYLPYAIFGDVAFLIEPLVIGYIFFLVIRYGDLLTLLSTLLVMSSYIILNILLEGTLTREEKAHYVLLAAPMYLFFYLMSLVEYLALIKTIVKLPTLRKSLGESRWEHVTRPTLRGRLATLPSVKS